MDRMPHSDTRAWDPTTIMWQVYPLGFAGAPVREPVDPAPRLGTAEDWQSLVAACDERGIAVILNGVFSHVADVMRY
ncbi:hypothetical protein I4I88_10970 [Corynebacterium diphtheriae bv. gravis]|nr:hypothetical protein [Corynebacterium diphtheriae bv. gravis]MBG9352997.1 hypothetical protein [Corynebacterium diphtheriae bv. gravis]